MADTEIVIQAQSTAFQRSGTTTHYRGFAIPQPWLAAQLLQSTINSGVSPTVTDAAKALLLGLLAMDETILPGGITLKNAQTLFPTAFNGADQLQALYDIDPFGTDYEDNTKALYERQYDKARIAAQSGPTNVRGATARQAFELAALDVEMANNRFREIWQSQVALAAVVSQAVVSAANTETERWRVQLQAQQQQAAAENERIRQRMGAIELLERMKENNLRYVPMSAELLALPTMLIDEKLTGDGQQASAQTTFGMNYWR